MQVLEQVTENYDPDQPRDERGRWGGGGSGSKEEARQEDLASKQSNPLAHPSFVLGMENDIGGETLRYVAAYGQEFKSASLPEGTPRGEPRECYKNASLLVVGNSSLRYAEGFAESSVTGGLMFQHAWAVTKDGTVVDNTWPSPEKCRYFGVVYDRGKFLKSLYKAKIYGVLGGDYGTFKKTIESGGRNLR